MSILPVGGIGATLPPLPPLSSSTAAAAPTATDPAAGGGSASFGQMVAKGLDSVQQLQTNADNLALKAATGDLTDIHSYTIAATEASLATQLTVAVRDKALQAFNSIMNMPL